MGWRGAVDAPILAGSFPSTAAGAVVTTTGSREGGSGKRRSFRRVREGDGRRQVEAGGCGLRDNVPRRVRRRRDRGRRGVIAWGRRRRDRVRRPERHLRTEEEVQEEGVRWARRR